ncbi:MAG TPA: ribonuclease E/G, partial [Clostridia bacterium]|nr:ribonuclease E/G [Clostridia bacterium]
AAGEDENVLAAEMNLLINKWNEILKKYKHAPAASAVQVEGDLVQTAVRDLFSHEVTRIAVNDRDSYDAVIKVLMQIAPDMTDRVQLVDTKLIFDYFNIEGALEKLLSRKIWLKNGSYIVIDHTEAMTVIDVNTGKFTGDSDLLSTALDTNILAAREIARQLRLRNIGGIIIVDFIDMLNLALKECVINELNKQLRKDRVKTTVLGMTALGLAEITRKKVYKSVLDATKTSCACCDGTGMVMDHIEVCMKIRRELIRLYEHTGIRDALVEVDNNLYPAVLNSGILQDELKGTLAGMRIYLKSNPFGNIGPYKVTKLINTDIPAKIKDAIMINI